MSIFKRRRFLFWLLKAYVKKSSRTILFSFGIGLVLFFLIKINIGFVFKKFIPNQKVVVGMAGSYTVDTLPQAILTKISRGLTSLSGDGKPHPDLVNFWQVRDDGKTYIFSLKNGIEFSDGSPLTSSDIDYGFKDVKVERPDKHSIIFRLKDSYSPFLITVSRPVFKNGFTGVGKYRVKDLELNGNFVQSITLVSRSDSQNTLQYVFYPTESSLKTAFALGEVSEAPNISSLAYHGMSFANFQNATVKKETDYSQLVTLFYNTKDRDLGERRLREALGYALPNKFPQGERSYTPYNPFSWARDDTLTLPTTEDIAHAKALMAPILSGSQSATLNFTLKTLPAYEKAAESIKSAWKQIGVEVKIEKVDTVLSNFQMFLGEFNVPKDPDQYTLWHSDQQNNITNYDNKRIDKLLEDGRKTIDTEERKKIYSDFQKYLLDDPPAAFLFFPYTYDVVRK